MECNYRIGWWPAVGFIQMLFWFAVACSVAMTVLTLLNRRARWIASSASA